MWRRLGGLLFAASLLSCTSPSQPPLCDARFDDYSSPAPGELELTGSFSSDESVLIRYTAGSQNLQKTGTYDSTFGKVRFTGLPSGSLTITVVVSCEAGQEEVITFTTTIL